MKREEELTLDKLKEQLEAIPKYDRGISWQLSNWQRREELAVYGATATALKFVLDNTDAILALLSTPKPEATEGVAHEKGHLELVGEVHAMNDGFGDRPIWFDYQPIVGTKLYAYRAALNAKPENNG